MTPETRALIEAAEMMVDTHLIAPEDVVEALRAAISSAKAAEEGVETTTDYFVETPNSRGDWVLTSWLRPSGTICSHLSDYADAISYFSVMWQEPARLMKRTRTETNTVIEVREKEGL